MAEHKGGQWNVAVKENEVYLERVSEDDERLFEDSLAPEEARQFARLLRKHADKISESGADSKDDDSDEDKSEDEDDEDEDEDEDDDDDEDEDTEEDSKDSKDTDD